MRRHAAFLALGLIALLALAPRAAGVRTISKAALQDKIRGGWAGKMIGVAYGAPTEFQSNARINDAAIDWAPERVAGALKQDDLYVGITMAETMDRIGFGASVRQYGEAFKSSEYELWHANAAARRLLNLGLDAPLTGDPRYNIHANDIDFQIEADFIGLMSPGLPQESNRYCERVGRVMNHGDGLYGGMFVSGMYTAAFFERDPRRVVELGLACLPKKSGYARVIRDVLAWAAKYPADWKKTWQMIEDKWDVDDACPEGALAPFNIDARINGAYITLALLYGGGDFGRTLEIAARAGQDSDCNPSTAGGILGVMLGYGGIPDRWKSGVPAVADDTFEFTRSSLNDICRSTFERALKLVRMAGGGTNETQVTIPQQAPTAPPLEQWDMGVPEKRVPVTDPAWRFEGFSVARSGGPEEVVHMQAGHAGAEALLNFTGSALAVLGDVNPSGGRAEVFLDGKLTRGIDAYVAERTHDPVLWHIYGLRQGPHRLRIVAGRDADPRSAGTTIAIREAVVYRAR